MPSLGVGPMMGVVQYEDRDDTNPRMRDPLPVLAVVSRRTRREARRQQRQRLTNERQCKRSAQAAKDEVIRRQEATAEQRAIVEMREISTLQAEVFELITRQDAWDATFRAGFKTRLAYKLHVEYRNENFMLAADGRVWMKLSDFRQFMPFHSVKNTYQNERMRADLLGMLAAARSHLQMR